MTKIRKEKAELSSAAKNKKLSTLPPRPQLSFPRMRGSIHPHVPEAAFGNVLTAADNDESETNSNTDNEVPKPSHGAYYTMGPRVREDDGVRESMVNLLSLTHATANAKDNSCANNDGNIEASLDDCLISPFLITPSIVPLNTIFY
ncbi:hypothetical protein [Vibrio vulnificus YJ016]|uniref:Uncharacterized protein n=1 Tax=Vibrio vulnificus (strain YJ016) TaxID=196600 RepID=Q7MPN2_VIBVY|nr:hypothetical protein [Vibrio vulnificus]BAC93095.1 hypothetical protein [Vibrio vulnificus YJ016]